MTEIALRQAGISELSCQFSRFIARLDNSDDELVATTAALVSEAIADGHVCLNLAQMQRHDLLSLADLPEQISEWLQRLKLSHVVGQPGDYKPLILTEDGLLYLYRYWLDEQNVAQSIRQRLQSIAIKNPKQLQQDFANWNGQLEGVDWQKVAVLMALTRQFSVISGGPGTGKTTIVLRLIQMLYGQDQDLKIALAAPTGKAAARLQRSIVDSGHHELKAKTLHRLLGITAENINGHYHRDRPLPVDVVIVDEASMIDLGLMAKLMQALPDRARLVLLGDSQQLASVESGAVLANLCDQPPQISTEFSQLIQDFTDIELPALDGEQSTLADSVVMLRHSYRFDEHSEIGRLATAVQSGDIQAVYDVFNIASPPVWQQQIDAVSIQQQVFAGYQAYFDAVSRYDDALTCLQLFDQYRVLTALKQGEQSVSSVNILIERQIQRQGWRTHQHFYPGRPIMVTQNDYRQRLFNGDTGLILYDEQGILRACFMADNEVRWIDLTRLPAHETVFAMTIHKSQGSEFDTVTVLLPDDECPLLNRELLYTAITRAKKQVNLLCSDTVLQKTVLTQHQRETGLANLLSA